MTKMDTKAWPSSTSVRRMKKSDALFLQSVKQVFVSTKFWNLVRSSSTMILRPCIAGAFLTTFTATINDVAEGKIAQFICQNCLPKIDANCVGHLLQPFRMPAEILNGCHVEILS